MIPHSFLAHGAPHPLPPQLPLRAGPIALSYEAGDLRTLTYHNQEILRRIYAAVRDPNWATIPGAITKEKIQHSDTEFFIQYRSEHRADPIHFVWDATLSGKSDGSIEFQFDGEALSTFQRNRIGLCVLHPPASHPHQRARARYTNGSSLHLNWPSVIAQEQPVHGFHDLAGLDSEFAPDHWLECAFDGDVFETEDQRNWIDASFKTYCTPLRIPIPMEIRAGTRVRQRVRLALALPRNSSHTFVSHAPPKNTPSSPPQPTVAKIHLTPSQLLPLPKFGSSLPSHTSTPSLPNASLQRLQSLRLAHLRVDWSLHNPNPSSLLPLLATATQIGSPIELALSVPDPISPSDWEPLVASLLNAQSQGARFARFLVSTANALSTRPSTLHAAQRALARFHSPIGSGADRDLYELNLLRPAEPADAIFWSINPQVHAFDNTSIAETPAAVLSQLLSVHSYFPNAPLHVSPITLKPRPDPWPSPTSPPNSTPPPHSDPRQMSLFSAAWTLATIAALTQGRAASATFFDTHGWTGLLGPSLDSSGPPDFPAPPHAVFPAYFVFADIAHISSSPAPISAIESASSHPHALACLTLQSQSQYHLLIANFTRHPILVSPPPLGAPFQARLLTPANAENALRNPESFQSLFAWPHPTLAGSQPFELPPHSYGRIDYHSSPTPRAQISA